MSRSAEDRMRKRHFLAAVLLAVAGLVGVGLGAGAAGAQDRPVEPLTGKSPPAPPAAAYDAIVQDTRALVVLGKALFWDSGVGSRGDLACASCHFHAGADPRTTNQLNPGLLVLPEADPSFGSTSAGLTGSGAKGATGGGGRPIPTRSRPRGGGSGRRWTGGDDGAPRLGGRPTSGVAYVPLPPVTRHWTSRGARRVPLR
jgi:hypothetical protein